MKKHLKRIFALVVCVVVLAATATTAFAADIPFRNYQTTGTGNFTFTIDTSDFSGYSNTSIGHFTVQTTNYSSSSYITVTVKYGNTSVGYAMISGNNKLENCSFDSNFYYPAGTYTITVSVAGTPSNGWTGVWLYH